MDAGTVFFHVAKGVPLAIIAVVCLCRASMLDQRARPAVKFVLVLLGMTAFGSLFSMFMPEWVAKGCFIGLALAICLMLIEGEKRWRNGPPNELLKDEEQYPRKNRREVVRRTEDRARLAHG